MKRILLVTALVLSAFGSLFATETIIQGNAFFYRNRTIEIHRYLDLFTFKSQQLASVDIPADGSFRFTVDVQQTDLYLIKIGKVYAHLFVEPGDMYTLVIPEPLEEDQFNPAKDVFVQPEIFEFKSQLNYQITELEKRINGFFIEWTSEVNMLAGGGIRRAADSVIVSLQNEFGKEESAYFQEYLHYRLAEFSITTNHSRSSVFEAYVGDQALAYRQLSFANTMNSFYSGYMLPHSSFRFCDSLHASIRRADYQGCDAALAADAFLQRKDLRQLVFAHGLYELGRMRKYPIDIILQLLDSLQAQAVHQEIASLAANAKASLTLLAPGTVAPDFTFADVAGNLYRISEYEGRYIYIQFFDEFTPEALRQMSLMKVLREGYGADIAMFSLSTTESLRRLREIPQQHDFDWFFGKLGSPYDVMDLYALRALPDYVFLDESLRIVMNPTPAPGGRIERRFAAIWNARHPNKIMPFKLQPPALKEGDGAVTPESVPTPP